jgi:hypothetical protein
MVWEREEKKDNEEVNQIMKKKIAKERKVIPDPIDDRKLEATVESIFAEVTIISLHNLSFLVLGFLNFKKKIFCLIIQKPPSVSQAGRPLKGLTLTPSPANTRLI